MMRRTFVALWLLCASFGLAAEPTSAPTRPLVVVFYADWCMNCKILMPKLTQAMKGLEEKLELVKLDSTDDTRKLASRERAKALGISELWYVNHATGWAALFDRNRQQVDSLKQDMSEEELHRHLVELAEAPSSKAMNH
jgi:thiol-disulfide isomerase/thioredoxin